MASPSRSFDARLIALFACVALHACGKSSQLPDPDPRGCLAATVTHEEHTDGADGVTHDLRYRDRFIRCEDHVWIERILPMVPAQAPADEHDHQKQMPPAHQVAQLITRWLDGHVSLALVSRRAQQVIEMSPESYDALHFDGEFETAAHLVSPRGVDAMPVTRDRPAPPGAIWHEKRSDTGTVAILWSTTLDFPLAVESESPVRGRKNRLEVSVSPLPADRDLPWKQIGSYLKKNESDFAD